MKLEDVTPGAQVTGVVNDTPVTVVAAKWIGGNALNLTYKTQSGKLDERILYRDQEPRLELARKAAYAFDADADASKFRLAAEALRIRMAGRFDPMLAVHTSDLEPLPHQIQAVYDQLLDKTPLRFLLADDPGAGKTIMAGLYIKELMLRGDLERCLIVAPGGLVEQWQDELREKFGQHFELLTRELIDTEPDGNPFPRHPLLIARMDQLSRSDDLKESLKRSDWDLVVVDEAHGMSASYFGNELKKTKRYQLGELLGRTARHFLLMTATPHSGREENFQLFLALLDTDRFEGKYRDAVHTVNTDGLMRRMVKEDLKTFEGKPLFPERRASTVTYELSPYLPRLTDRQVLDDGIRHVFSQVIWDQDGFAVAAGYDDATGKYRELALPAEDPVPQISDTTLLVHPSRAIAQREAERAEAEAARAATAAAATAAAGASTAGPGDGSGTGSSTQPGGASAAGGGTVVPGGSTVLNTSQDNSPAGGGSAPPAPKNTRFFGTFRLDPERYGKDITKVAQEVIQHLAKEEGVDLEITVDIKAVKKDGFPDTTVRIVSENARTLKFEDSSFEDR